MPQDQSQLRHLFALLAQFQEGRLACGRLHELCDPVQNALVLLRHADVGVRLDVVGGPARYHVVVRHGSAVIARDAIVVLLLRGLCCDGGSLSLSLHLTLLCLCLKLAMLLGYMVVRLLMVTLRPLSRVLLLLVREDMLHWLLILIGAGEVRRNCGGRRERRVRWAGK